MSLRPVLLVVHRERAVAASGATCPAGQVTVPACSSTVKSSMVSRAFDRRAQRLGLDHRGVSGLLDRIPQVPGALGRVAVPGQRLLACPSARNLA